MCEVFAISGSYPATITHSMRKFARNGGLTADHVDGWGVAHLEDRDAHVFRDADAAAENRYRRLISAFGSRSKTVVSHIRRAIQGEIALRDPQPFIRELVRQVHLFAHNGELRGFEKAPELRFGCHPPTGETDSRYAFCALLHRLRPLWGEAKGIPDLSESLRVVVEFASENRHLGLTTSSAPTAIQCSSTVTGGRHPMTMSSDHPGCF
jgi:predicted glutamine amidotransferase